MPTWNPALWDASQDDGVWAYITATPPWTGYIYYRLRNGGRLLDLSGDCSPDTPIAPNVFPIIATLPIGSPSDFYLGPVPGVAHNALTTFSGSALMYLDSAGNLLVRPTYQYGNLARTVFNLTARFW